MDVLTHNLKVVARRLNVILEMTAERLSKVTALATMHGLPHGNRGTAFALVALNKISGKLGGQLSQPELNVVVRALAYAHDHCVMGNEDPVAVVQTAIRNLCVTNRIFGAEQIPLMYHAIPIVEVVREYKVVRDDETAPVKSTEMVRAMLTLTHKRAKCFVPGIDDDETDLIKLGYM